MHNCIYSKVHDPVEENDVGDQTSENDIKLSGYFYCCNNVRKKGPGKRFEWKTKVAHVLVHEII